MSFGPSNRERVHLPELTLVRGHILDPYDVRDVEDQSNKSSTARAIIIMMIKHALKNAPLESCKRHALMLTTAMEGWIIVLSYFAA